MLRKTVTQFPLASPYLLVTAITIGMLWPTWERLFVEWLKWEQVLAHGLPTFLIFLGLLVVHPPRLVNPGKAGMSTLGGALLLLTVLFWALLELVRIDTLAYLMIPPVLLTVCWALLGFRSSLHFLPYVLLFSLSLPIWADLVPVLIELATIVVSRLVAMMGMTALVEGANITLPYGRLVIADGCSGIRYFAVSILLAMITAVLNDYRWKGWIVTVSLAMLIGLVVNWVRITALVVIAYQSKMESELVADHETFGWLVYAAFVVPVMLLAPVHRRRPLPGTPLPVSFRGLGFIVVAFLVGPLGISLVYSAATETPAWDIVLEGKRRARPEQLPLPMSLPPQLDQAVWRAGPSAWVSIAQFQKSGRGEKLVPYLHRPLDTGGWYLESTRNDGQLKIYQHLGNQGKVIVSQLYQVGARQTHSYATAKLFQIPAALTGQSRFALITIQSTCGARGCDSAIARAKELGQNLTLTPAQ